jgi:hypothetical protein
MLHTLGRDHFHDIYVFTIFLFISCNILQEVFRLSENTLFLDEHGYFNFGIIYIILCGNARHGKLSYERDGPGFK